MTVYVGNLPFSMGDEELKALFEAHGTVSSAGVVMDRETGRSRGFGFVEMADDATAKNAIEALTDHVEDGRPPVVNEARPHTSNNDRSGGGRRW